MKAISNHIIRYAVVAAICASLNILILVVGERIGLGLLVSAAASFACCILAGYALHCRFTFERPPDAAGLARYTIAMAANFPLTVLLLWVLRDLLALPMMFAAAASVLLLTLYNYGGSRIAVLRKKEASLGE